MTLVDSGAQIFAISNALHMKLDLPVSQLPDEVNFVGFGGVTFKNKGYTRIRLRIPGIKGFDKDVLLFVQPDSDYTKNVPVLLGTNIIDFILEHITTEELNSLEPIWGTFLGPLFFPFLVLLHLLDHIDTYINIMIDGMLTRATGYLVGHRQ